MVTKVLRSGWFLLLLLILAVLSGTWRQVSLLQAPESRLFDRLTALRPPAAAPVVLVEIDDESLARLGPWPWPRSRTADLLGRLAAAEAKAIALHPTLQGGEVNHGLTWVREAFGQIDTDMPETAALREQLEKAAGEADGDRALTEVLGKAGNVVLCLDYRPAAAGERDLGPHPAWWPSADRLIAPAEREVSIGGASFPWPLRQQAAPAAVAGLLPPEELMEAATGLAHGRFFPDRDGVVRRIPLALEVDGRALPALPLALAAAWSGEKIAWRQGDGAAAEVGLGRRNLPTDAGFRLLSAFDPRGVQRLSAARVLAGAVPEEALRGRAVVVGVTAEGAGRKNLPRRESLPEAEIAALAAADILGGAPLFRPAWAFPLETAVLLYLGFFLMVVLPRIPVRIGLLLLGGFLFTWWGVASFLLVRQGVWLHMVPAAALAAPGFLLLQLRRALAPRLAESIELNKMLGLSLQGQGMLDMALEKFSRCPAEDPAVRELLYNLGLDFERKRMHNKAVSVYRRILQTGNFRDVREKVTRLEEFEGTVILGAGRSGPLHVGGNGAARPTLGRYEILRELGQGAMGTVYLGRDPRINREVAIKTMRYGELEEGELAGVKERFFREAEAAGRLSHPNIVTIYDAGEDHDLAFLAMEVLAGRSLDGHCRKDALLPMKQVLGIIAQVADALDYAHRQEVVHRDIKPANIMLLESGQVKVTDFGIARLLSASGTQTGTVLGTPSYMSPEQVAGKKVDGRSDLFSLGTVFYELLTGVKPFTGESIAALMYTIANTSHKPVSRIAKVPAGCSRIVAKLLTRELTKRYRTGAEVAADVRRCLERLG